MATELVFTVKNDARVTENRFSMSKMPENAYFMQFQAFFDQKGPYKGYFEGYVQGHAEARNGENDDFLQFFGDFFGSIFEKSRFRTAYGKKNQLSIWKSHLKWFLSRFKSIDILNVHWNKH